MPDHRRTPLRIAESALATSHTLVETAEFYDWFAALGRKTNISVDQIPLDDMAGWTRDPQSGNYHHDSGRFFSIEGLDVHVLDGLVHRWSQPIIHQPEIGILGILVKEFNGVLHCLLQAKVEPGNPNGVQLSPTVQATRSNYTRVHRGKPVPYLGYFRTGYRRRAMADVRQSEQGARFYQKRNRNMIVEITEDIEVLDGFCWLSLGQVHHLLTMENLMNMDARTVLSCLPFTGVDLAGAIGVTGDDFRCALIRSCDEGAASRNRLVEVLSWITERRTETSAHAVRIPLSEVRNWRHVDGRISHESGLFFDVIGVDVRAGNREVVRWNQPMIAPRGTGVVAFLACAIDGVLHVLVRAHTEAGYVDVVELAPTVQCIPDNYRDLPAAPPFLDVVLAAGPDQIRFDTVLSEEGGRFHHSRNRYVVVEVDSPDEYERPNFRWLTLHQLVELLRHSHYLNVEARSLVACLYSLLTTAS